MPTVSVSFSPLPAHVRTARMVALATARRAGIDEGLVDEVRFAVGEACSRAVALNAATDHLITMLLRDDGGRFSVEVHDVGSADAEALSADFDLAALALTAEPHAAPLTGEIEDVDAPVNGVGHRLPLPDALPPGFGLAVIAGLVEDVTVTRSAAGTTVELGWPLGSEPIA